MRKMMMVLCAATVLSVGCEKESKNPTLEQVEELKMKITSRTVFPNQWVAVGTPNQPGFHYEATGTIDKHGVYTPENELRIYLESSTELTPLPYTLYNGDSEIQISYSYGVGNYTIIAQSSDSGELGFNSPLEFTLVDNYKESTLTTAKQSKRSIEAMTGKTIAAPVH